MYNTNIKEHIKLKTRRMFFFVCGSTEQLRFPWHLHRAHIFFFFLLSFLTKRRRMESDSEFDFDYAMHYGIGGGGGEKRRLER